MIMISWTLFAITDFTKLGQYFGAMFGLRGGMDWVYYLRNYGVVLVIGIIFSTPVIERLGEKCTGKRAWLRYAAMAVVLVVSIAYLVDATYNPFLYFRF